MFMFLNYPARGPGWAGKYEMIFPTDRAGPAKEKWIFQRAEPGEQKRTVFPNWLNQQKKKTNNIAGQSEPTK